MKKHFVIIFAILCFSLQTQAQTQNIRFERIYTTQQYTQNTINGITQDQFGFIWFGTEDGLCRYDGYDFIYFRHQPQNSNSLSSNYINTLFIDSENTLWIGTNEGGLNRFNYQTESFVHYKNNPNDSKSIGSNSVLSIKGAESGYLWIGTRDNGLNKLEIKTGRFQHFKIDKTGKNGIINPEVHDITVDTDNSLWLSTFGGVSHFNTKTGNCINYPYNVDDTTGIIDARINTGYLDKHKNLWFGGIIGLCKFNRQSNTFQRILYDWQRASSTPKYNIFSIKDDKAGNLWVGANNGLFLIDTQSKNIQIFEGNIENPYSLSDNSISSIFVDRVGNLWFGNSQGGINKYDRLSNRFLCFTREPAKQNTLSDSKVRSLYFEDENTLWIGTAAKGLNRLNLKTHEYQYFMHENNNPNSLAGITVTAILKDRQGYIWVGTQTGLSRMKLTYVKGKAKAQIKNYFHNFKDHNSLIDNFVQSIYQDTKGRLWLGTSGGLQLYDYANDCFSNTYQNEPNNPFSLGDNSIQAYSIVEDKQGNFWLGTWNGLSKMVIEDSNLQKVKFYNFRHDASDPNSLSNNNVICLTMDENETLWAGTCGGGINKVNYNKSGNNHKKVTFTKFSGEAGLPNGVIYGILSDKQGHIWVSTNNGLSEFDCKANLFRNYTVTDGLQSNTFYWGASAISPQGFMGFGGIKGFNLFYPNKIHDTDIPPLAITDFQVFNKSVKINQDVNGRIILEQSLAFTKRIYLTHHDFVFSFHFVSLDFSKANQKKYCYILEPFEKNWNFVDNDFRNATYTNLNPGKYTFRIKGSNRDGFWNEQGISIQLIVIPPFWKTWWFYLLVFLLLASLVILIFRLRLNQLLKIERIRSSIAKDLHDEIGSTLSGIAIMSEITGLSPELSSKSRETILLIGQNARIMLESMDDIIWAINPKNDKFQNFVLRLQEYASPLFEQKEIKYNFNIPKELHAFKLKMTVRRNLYLIVKESINNIVKYAECRNASIDFEIDNHKLSIKISDDGKGFNMKTYNQNRHGLSNMQQRAKEIKGVLLIDSAVGKGTQIMLEVKL